MNPNPDGEELEPGYDRETGQTGKRSSQLVRKGKLILYNRPNNPVLDESIVSVKRYNCFGTSLFPGKNSELQLTAGVTSPHPGDGKTMVASNLAAFFALDTQDDTVLIDLNFRDPMLHHVFGLPPTPGILDSFRSDTITLSRSAIKGLWVLPLGAREVGPMSFDRVLELREVLATLKRQFRFVLVDLPSALEPDFPAMISSHLDGYFVVLYTGKSKRTEVTKVVHILNENKVIGFVMNRVAGEELI